MRVNVKAHYRQLRNGKKVLVRAYSTTRKGATEGGSEYEKRKQGKLVEFNSWEDFRDEINKVGWENMTLSNDSDYDWTEENGHKVTKISDPRGDTQYIGFRVGGKLVGATNIYDENGIVAIGDFEIFPQYKRKGYGRKFYSQLEKKFPGREIILNYGSEEAKKFWESCGFKANPRCTIMEKQVNK